MIYPKSVYLDYASSSNERYVTPEGYEQIKELIKFYQLCKQCHERLDQSDHLLVGKICLACMLKKHSSLTFLGPVSVDSDGDYTYAYSDPNNIVYTSTANSSEEARKDIFASITKSGFTVPEYYVPFKGVKDSPIKLGRYNWTTYGSLKTNSVIVLEYSDTYPTIKAVFLSYKGGEVVELNKRNLAFKQMFERAKSVIERTKHKKWGDDYFMHPDGYEVNRISDEMLYPIIAQFESAVWDVQKAFMPAYQQPELIEAEPQKLEEVVSENQDTAIVEPTQEEIVQEHETATEPAPEEQVASEIEITSKTVEETQEEQTARETLSVAESLPEEQAAPEQKKRGKRGNLSVVPTEEIQPQEVTE